MSLGGRAVGALSINPLAGRTILGGYSFAASFQAGSAAAQNLLSLENPAGSNRIIAIASAYVQGIHTAASATSFIYRFRRTTATPSAGTVQTAQNRRTSDGAPSGIVRTAPTAVGAAGQIWTGSPGVLVTAAGEMTSAIMQMLYDLDIEDRYMFLADSEGILISADANAITWSHLAGFSWFELSP